MALDDFRARIRKYEEVYETITNRDLHYIKLIDMCATPVGSRADCATSGGIL
jgi:6-phosphofructo-2-kinase